ncbi:MAG TPA: hypothetical protein PLK90_10845 [Clostridiales bacterium]|nr:hypothetical protein [Clostridiales bacterium]
MIYFGDYSVTVAAEKINGKTRISQTEYHFRIFPKNRVTIFPAEKIRFYTFTDENKALQTVLIVTSASGEFKLLQLKKIGLEDSEKRNIYNDLSFFIQSDRKEKFRKSIAQTTKLGITGFIISLISSLLLFSYVVTLINKILVKKQLDKTVINISNPIFMLITNNKDYDLSVLNKLKLPEIEKTAVACNKSETSQIKSKLKGNYEFLYSDESCSSAQIVFNALKKFHYENGNLLVVLKCPELEAEALSKLMDDHKSKDNECTILTEIIKSRRFPAGKIIRNVVKKIIRITDTAESFESEETTCEMFQGILYVNIKELYKHLSELDKNKTLNQTEITSVVEQYFLSNKKVNSYCIGEKISDANNSARTVSKRLLHKTSAALIFSTSEYNAPKVENHFKILSAYCNDSIGIIIHPDFRNFTSQLKEYNPEIIFSESGKGEAYELSAAKNWLKDLTGSLLLIPESCDSISDDLINKVLTDHKSRGNTCTALKRSDSGFIVFCFSSAHLFNALDRINQYEKKSLVEIADILKQQKRSVEIIEVQL